MQSPDAKNFWQSKNNELPKVPPKSVKISTNDQNKNRSTSVSKFPSTTKNQIQNDKKSNKYQKENSKLINKIYYRPPEISTIPPQSTTQNATNNETNRYFEFFKIKSSFEYNL